MFGYLGWQLFVTDFINAGVQAQAATDLESDLVEASFDLEVETFEPEELAEDPSLVEEFSDPVPHFRETVPETGEAFAFIRIPKIGVDQVLFEGVDRRTLTRGPGHMETSPLPGQPGNAVISGHRTTYGRPFFDFDLLKAGDLIEVETAIGTTVYQIRETHIVAPTDIWVTNDRPGGWLTITTCHPKFSARQRLVVFAEMVDGPNFEYVQLQNTVLGAAS